MLNSVWHRRFPEELALCFWTYGFLVYDSVDIWIKQRRMKYSNSNKESWVEATRLGKCDWCVYDDLRRRFFEAPSPKLASKKAVLAQQRSCNSLRFGVIQPKKLTHFKKCQSQAINKIISSPQWDLLFLPWKQLLIAGRGHPLIWSWMDHQL